MWDRLVEPTLLGSQLAVQFYRVRDTKPIPRARSPNKFPHERVQGALFYSWAWKVQGIHQGVDLHSRSLLASCRVFALGSLRDVARKFPGKLEFLVIHSHNILGQTTVSAERNKPLVPSYLGVQFAVEFHLVRKPNHRVLSTTRALPPNKFSGTWCSVL